MTLFRTMLMARGVGAHVHEQGEGGMEIDRRWRGVLELEGRRKMRCSAVNPRYLLLLTAL